MQLLTQLQNTKRRLSPTMDSIDEAYAHAYMLLSDSHRHEINDALDTYHNTLINEIQKMVEEGDGIQLQNLQH